jgi:tRNA pseudouridine(38-40) synthase
MQTEMFTWKLVLAYDGGEFHGWQIQPDQPTVQGLLRDALLRITGEDVLPQGSGRTDAGVHALGQVASFVMRGTAHRQKPTSTEFSGERFAHRGAHVMSMR